MEGWLHEVGAALGVLLGILIGRRGKAVAVKTECETCKERGGLTCPPPGLPPAQFWLTVTGGVVGIVVGYTTLQIEVRELKVWRDQAAPTRFTTTDGAVLEQKVYREIEGLCVDLRRLQLELNKVPSKDCERH